MKKSNNILCKISNFNLKKHNGTKYIDKIKSINNYQHYYSIIESDIYDIDKTQFLFIFTTNNRT